MATVGSSLYDRFYSRRLTEEKMRIYNIPLADQTVEGAIKPIHDNFGFKKGGRQMPHDCCKKPYGSQGCRSAPSHVHKYNVVSDLSGYKSTTPKVKDTGKDHGVFVMDTESVHTKKGLEVARVTVLDTDCKPVYESYCLPTTEIIDYNTIWSGITESDMRDVTKTFEEMQKDLLDIFNDKTVLVGHCISSDLLMVKIIHRVVVDTQDLYPHPRGLPLRRGLKEMAENELGRRIQTGDGHDSREDAEVTMKLARRRV